MDGRKVVETDSLRVIDVIGLAVFLDLLLALLGPGIRVIRGVSPFPWASVAFGRRRVILGLSAAQPTFRVTSRESRFCTSLNGQN